jgi:hypothetical protein
VLAVRDRKEKGEQSIIPLAYDAVHGTEESLITSDVSVHGTKIKW